VGRKGHVKEKFLRKRNEILDQGLHILIFQLYYIVASEMGQT
jgi:hypothetical protein